MVRLQRVGKPRPFIRGLLLTIVTFGIYGIYWRYKAHDEVYKQFELEQDGRDEGIVWLILGLLIGVLMLVYDWMFVSNINHVQQRLGLRPRIGPLGFILIPLLAVVFFVGAVIAFVTGGYFEAAESGTLPPGFAAGAGIGVILFLLGFVVIGFPFYRLQADINDVWAAYDARAAEFRGQAAGTPPAPPAAGPGTGGAPASGLRPGPPGP